MRAKEFLVEYSRQVTVQNYGQRLLAAMRKDPTYKNMDNVWDNVPGNILDNVLDKLLNVIESADPTPHKEYVQWLCKIYILGGVKMEDITSLGKDTLTNFHMLKKRNIMPAFFRDINKYKSLDALATEVRHYMTKIPKVEMTNKGRSNEIFNNANIRVIVPLDMQAAKYYGQGTTWCTAADNNNRFDQYNKDGNLYIILPKQPDHIGEKYQLHFPSCQFMNEEDKEVDFSALMTRWPELRTLLAPEGEKHGFIPLLRAGPQIIANWDKIKQEAVNNIFDSVLRNIAPMLRTIRQDMFREAGATSEEALLVTVAAKDAVLSDPDGLIQAVASFVFAHNFSSPDLAYTEEADEAMSDWVRYSKIQDAFDNILNGTTTNMDGYPAHLSVVMALVNAVLPALHSEIKHLMLSF